MYVQAHIIDPRHDDDYFKDIKPLETEIYRTKYFQIIDFTSNVIIW